jgi:ATP/maltotriose-dependent transcriptional regulator MalT
MLDAHGELDEGLRYEKVGMLRRALDKYESTARRTDDPEIVAEALLREAWAYRAWCKWDKALDAAQRSATIAQRANLEVPYAEALNAEAMVYHARGEFGAAIPRYEEILSVTNDQRMRGVSLQNLGSIAAQRGDLDSAEWLFLESSRCFQRAQYTWGEAVALNNYAAVALDRGKLQLAEVIARQAMEAAEKVGDLELLGIAAMNAAEALAPRRELVRAEVLAMTALGHFTREENGLRRAQCLRVLGDVQLLRGDLAGAGRFYERALRQAEAAGSEYEGSRIRDCLEVVRRED